MSESLRNAYIWRWLKPLALRKLPVLMTVCMMLPSFNVLYINACLMCYAVVLYYIWDIGVNFMISYWCCKHFSSTISETPTETILNMFIISKANHFNRSHHFIQISWFPCVLHWQSHFFRTVHYLPGFLIQIASGVTSAASRLFTAHQNHKI